MDFLASCIVRTFRSSRIALAKLSTRLLPITSYRGVDDVRNPNWIRSTAQRSIWFMATLLLVTACNDLQDTGSSTTTSTRTTSTTSTAVATSGESSATPKPTAKSASKAPMTARTTQPRRPRPKPTPRTTTRTTPPAPRPAPVSSAPANCDPAYPDACLHDGIGDYDCAGGSGNGPNYVSGPIRVLPPDPFGLDRDGDGIGCE